MRHESPEQVVKMVVVRTSCDHCGAVAAGADPDGWLHFSSYHNDWGNDSIESSERWDVCSFACYLQVVRDIVARYSDSDTLTIDGKDAKFVRSMLAAPSRSWTGA